jgi:uncharacterized protein YaeQ
MAIGATMHHFAVQLNDVDRGVYEALEIKAARHPSESAEYLVARVLAYCLEYTEGISFSRGLAEPEEPTIAVRDLTGSLRAWIEVGAPDAARLHKASKAAPRVALYTHKPAAQLLRQLEGERIHKAHALEIYALDREMITGLTSKLERRMRFDLSVTDRHLFLSLGAATLSGTLQRLELAS